VTPLVLRPHAAPRDLRDAFIAVVALFLITAAVLLVGYAPLRVWLNPFGAALGALALAAVAVIALALYSVSAVELDDVGIRFRRITGRPRFLSWDNVTAVRRADRAEVVLRGWLLPPLPPRAAARSITSIGHYRFDWKDGSCYFPPADEAALLAHLERSWSGVIG
jgi:hypothetical protein